MSQFLNKCSMPHSTMAYILQLPYTLNIHYLKGLLISPLGLFLKLISVATMKILWMPKFKRHPSQPIYVYLYSSNGQLHVPANRVCTRFMLATLAASSGNMTRNVCVIFACTRSIVRKKVWLIAVMLTCNVNNYPIVPGKHLIAENIKTLNW